ncbi:MAG: AAA family ATPase [Phycisphaerae bacterium]|nr:AAA family ATPase [Phycisphaerae bacterium]
MKLLSKDEIQRGQELVGRVVEGLNQIILGKRDLVEQAVVGLLARGHILLEGLPGLGKTELVKGLSRLLGLGFRRVQFTPDLLPSDITGTYILQESADGRRFVFHPGPIFANLVLADEINRASPKTQSALLEAMQERRVTVLGTTHDLPAPFFVLATQNPIELEGTYPLPEAQIDRFMLKLDVAAASTEVLEAIITTRQAGQPPALSAVLSAEELGEAFAIVDQVALPPAVANYISRLVTATHRDGGATTGPAAHVKFGASPRAAIALASAGRALALLRGKPNVGFDEVRALAEPAVAHRLVMDYSARLENIDGRSVVRSILASLGELEQEMPEELSRK